MGSGRAYVEKCRELPRCRSVDYHKQSGTQPKMAMMTVTSAPEMLLCVA